MKTIPSYIVALMAALLGTACSESFLDTEPMTSVLDQNFYKTAADAEMALVGCYDGYQRTSSNGSFAFPVASEVLSDNCFGGTGHGDARNYQVIDRFDRSQSSADENIFNGTWTDYYAGIFRCNTLLVRLEGADFGDDAGTRNRVAGEARFLRALMYFDLVRLFERVPLLTEPTTDNVPQAAPGETFRLIVEDLRFAAANIPANAYPKANAAQNDGRVTTFAAKALLARVYLFYTGYYGQDDLGVTKAEVLQGLEDVVASNEYQLVGDFKSLWPGASYVPVPATNTLDRTAYAGKGNSEVVFAQKFNNTQNYNGMIDGNGWLVLMGLRQTRFSPYGLGWGACTVNPRLVSAFAGNDPRRTASVIDIQAEGVPTKDLLPEQREYTGYMNKKYVPTALPDGTDDVGGEGNFMISQDQDYIVIRYADVLLMAAELGSSSAQGYLDAVRGRVGLGSRPVSVETIREERRFEFAFEGIRYWDLLRQGIDVAANTIAQTQQVLSGNAPDQVVIDAAKVRQTRGFMQIPATQITLSKGVLTQNPGWN